MENKSKSRKLLTLLLTAVMSLTLLLGATACNDNSAGTNGVDGGSVDAGESTPSGDAPADPSESPSDSPAASPSASASASQ